MIKNVEEGLDNYKRLLLKHLTHRKGLRGKYGENTPLHVYDSVHLQSLASEIEALEAAVSVLGLTKEEQSRLDEEVLASL